MIQYEIIQGHRCGNTIRMLLRVIELASAGPNRQIMALFGNDPMVREALNMTRAICAPMQQFAVLSYTKQQIRFGNGSSIKFWNPKRMEIIRGLGEIYDYAVDTSVSRLDPDATQFLMASIRKN